MYDSQLDKLMNAQFNMETHTMSLQSAQLSLSTMKQGASALKTIHADLYEISPPPLSYG